MPERSNFSQLRSSLNESVDELCTKRKVFVPELAFGLPSEICESATGLKFATLAPPPEAALAVAVKVSVVPVWAVGEMGVTLESGAKPLTPTLEANATESQRKRRPKCSL